MPTRPRTVVFDVVETLMSLENLRPRLAEAGLDPGVLEHWYDRMLRDGMALTLAGDYEPFPRVAGAALRAVAGGDTDDDAVAHVLAGFGTLDAHPDAAPAMRALAEGGVAMVCLTNGAAETTTAFLERNGLDGFLDRVISVADVRSWKPPVRVYDHALDQLGQSAGAVALVAVHAFDCHGAKRAGLTTGWASRREGRYADIFTPADVEGSDLAEVARGLLALPQGGAG
ncbi:2-haloacid dehalogenase [Lipingzhangella halophila]|uniref:2-haloacid dehalogenase n=1 Tax=Lipingzhangella halophila TaxID=1783352 RepID=A0A7W7RCR8_9ACTN|nr:haloacid dehalogenase type II [Lipingzhangella halophila]MBB4929598.1 2-haloacid dehalogenase [Lipingzhangella halophila]